jgi:predicted AAA+ superfamily ATPase
MLPSRTARAYAGVRVHQEYLRSILFRDLIERHDLSHPRVVIELAHRLLDNVASLYSLNRLTGYLKSLGLRTSKTAVGELVSHFEDAYFLFTVRLFDASRTKSNANPKKIYCVDHAFVTQVYAGILINTGHLLENLIFMALRRVTQDIFYYRTSRGREVDFLYLASGSRHLVQVCEKIVRPDTRKREITALAEAMDEQGLDQGTIVTRAHRETIEVSAGRIQVVPAWSFLLEMSE